MKKKVNIRWPELEKLKSQLYWGDYKLILKTINESDSSITYDNLLAAFNNRSIDELIFVKILNATTEFVAEHRTDEEKAA